MGESYMVLTDARVTNKGGKVEKKFSKGLGFGAAWSVGVESGNPKVFLSSNDADGLFELHLPITVNSKCWVTAAGKTCEETPSTRGSYEMTWRAKSVETTRNDGLNCPEAEFNYCDDGKVLDE